jgi:hypothetical protein
MATILPPATEVAVGLGGWLDSTGLPDVFVGFEPLPAPPVDRPADPAARAIGAAAEASTFKVSAATCGLSSVGTGFVVAAGYIVTNAHVVAGSGERGIRVSGGVGQVLDATRSCSTRPRRGAAASTGCVPCRWRSLRATRIVVRSGRRSVSRGRRLTILPAAVAERYPATGHDIYGEDRIRREILELRAEIDRGDSGGPFILADGTVGGVVYAEARTNPDVGYALAPSAVAAGIRPGIGRREAVETGECLR